MKSSRPLFERSEREAAPDGGASVGNVRSASSQNFERVLFAALIAGLAGAPFWLGGNRPIAWAINAMWASGLVLVYEGEIFRRGGRHPVAIGRVWPAALAFLVTVSWCLVQVSIHLPPWYQHPIWEVAREALRVNIAGSISVDRDATLLALLRFLTASCVFWLSLQLCRSAHRARQLIKAVALIGLAYALYGLVAFFVFPNTLLWMEKSDYLDVLTSTFVNRNSYATYADLGLLAAVGMTLSTLAAAPPQGSMGRQAASFVTNLAGAGGLWLGVSAVIATALIATASRGGIIAGTIGLMTGAVLSILQHRGLRGPRVVSVVIALLLFASIASAFGDLFAGRLASEGLKSDTRLAVYQTTMISIEDRPWLGFGYGTFEQVFPMYRDATTIAMLKWDKAHNTYLEILQGLGLPVAFMLFGGIGYLIARCFTATLGRHRNITAPLVASAASATVLAHAFVDFSLQIQGVTLTWIAILGSGVAQSWSSRTDTSLVTRERLAQRA